MYFKTFISNSLLNDWYFQHHFCTTDTTICQYEISDHNSIFIFMLIIHHGDPALGDLYYPLIRAWT